MKRPIRKAGSVRICKGTCLIEDQHEHHDLVTHIIRFQPIGIRKTLPGRDREGQWINVELQRGVDSRRIWQDGNMRKSRNTGKNFGVRVAVYFKPSHGIETARYSRFRSR